MSRVPHIIINGVRLSRAEAVTVQVAVTDLQTARPSCHGGDAVGDALAVSYRANAASILRIMREGRADTAACPAPDGPAVEPVRPMSRAEEHILSLASRGMGFRPGMGKPWWALIAPWHARRLLLRLEAEGLIVADRRPDGTAVFRTVREPA